MMDDIKHVDFERLNDFVDGLLEPAEYDRIERHLASCAACGERWSSLRAILDVSNALPAEIEPPADLWRDIRSRIAGDDTDRRGRSISGASRMPTPLRSSWGLRRPWALAAAAVVLVAVSSAVTAVLVRRPSTTMVERTVPATPPNGPLLPPASARAVDADYIRTVGELAETLELRRSRLDPATVAKVEASLRVIDQAIAEARRALADDPVNRTLVDILSANYERKLELLRRAAELPSRT
jgi:hypothetical protein